MKSSATYYIYVISDSGGETGEYVAKAAANQFKGIDYDLTRFPYIDDPERARQIIEEAKTKKSIVVFTTVLQDVRRVISEACIQYHIPYYDIMTPLVKTFKSFLEREPAYEPGTMHKLDEEYFNRVEAVEFAVKYDDGKDPRGIKKADIVVLGISRTSKTPLSMYLAHKNIKVANIPLVPEVALPKELFEISAKRIICLTNDPEKLNAIREERLKAMGLASTAIYAQMNRIMEELEYAHSVVKRIGCPMIDVSTKAIEETANIIINIMKENDVLEAKAYD